MRTVALRLVGAVSAASLVSACGLGEEGSGSVSAAPVVKLTVALPAPSELFNLPVVLAQRLGFFAPENLEVALVDVGSGSNAVQALLSGEAQVAGGFGGHPVSLAAKGKALRTFVTLGNSPGMVLAVSPRAKRSVASVSDLKGAVVGVSAPGSGTHHVLNYILSRHDLRAADVSVAGIGLAATAIAAMERGKVDAAVMVDPALSQLQAREAGTKLLVDTRKPGDLSALFGASAYPAISLYATADWLGRNAELARRVTNAVTRALRWMQDHDAAQIAAAMPPEYAAGDPALYARTIAGLLPTFSRDGRTDPEGVEAMRRMLALSVPEVETARIDLAATYTNEFVPSLDLVGQTP